MEYGSPEVRKIGARVELSPGFDLWMRGAKYGTVRKVTGDIASVKMDHWQVRKLVRCNVADLKPLR